MKISNSNIKLNLTDSERKSLRKNKIKKAEILSFGVDELELLMNISELRAKEINAYADFQRIPSVGLEFAKDLVFLGYYSVNALKGKVGAELLNAFEKKKGFMTDPCVEDQFRLAVHFANTADYSKTWWDFTSERKAFRLKNGYPADRPSLNWTEA